MLGFGSFSTTRWIDRMDVDPMRIPTPPIDTFPSRSRWRESRSLPLHREDPAAPLRGGDTQGEGAIDDERKREETHATKCTTMEGALLRTSRPTTKRMERKTNVQVRAAGTKVRKMGAKLAERICHIQSRTMGTSHVRRKRGCHAKQTHSKSVPTWQRRIC